jgi:hypothetical protein
MNDRYLSLRLLAMSKLSRVLRGAPVLIALFAPLPAAADFTQQGAKLVGTGAVGAANQGSSSAISGSGNTAIIGAPNGNSNTGAAWIFTRKAGS